MYRRSQMKLVPRRVAGPKTWSRGSSATASLRARPRQAPAGPGSASLCAFPRWRRRPDAPLMSPPERGGEACRQTPRREAEVHGARHRRRAPGSDHGPGRAWSGLVACACLRVQSERSRTRKAQSIAEEQTPRFVVS